MSEQIQVEVAYALPDRQTVIALRLGAGATARQAIEASGILDKHPEIDLAVNKIGVYSRPIKESERLHDGDRVEIYRPLTADPREMRKKRADKAKEEGRANPVTGAKQG
ncbi:RnfH family protein [Aeromonas diversa]|uniref:UPF0125 protein G114_14991 n=1 Tax=Aeromonas diversa CDC 2478-85 TaxID=1268237 RepID=N9VI95_9GAMM|nr:RnfH family protein [Aeromonas diversa]ENY71111.1 protein YfjF [Aeromonas diversa CDC 2478-85]